MSMLLEQWDRIVDRAKKAPAGANITMINYAVVLSVDAKINRLSRISGYAIGYAMGMRNISPEWKAFYEELCKIEGEGKE